MAGWYSIFLSCLLYPFLCQWTVRTTIWPSNPTPGCIPRGNHDFRKHRHSNIHSALFTIARTWKQPNCPSAEEWILSSFKRKKQFFYYDKSDTIHICVYTHIERETHKHFMGKQWKQWLTILGGSKITADGDCSREIKRHLLLGRKVMTNLDRVLKSRDIAFPTKVRLVKSVVFPVVMYGCESWTAKKAECWRIHAFELWCWRRLLRVPWTARRSNQSILKEISPGCSLKALMLKLKL